MLVEKGAMAPLNPICLQTTLEALIFQPRADIALSVPLYENWTIPE